VRQLYLRQSTKVSNGIFRRGWCRAFFIERRQRLVDDSGFWWMSANNGEVRLFHDLIGKHCAQAPSHFRGQSK